MRQFFVLLRRLLPTLFAVLFIAGTAQAQLVINEASNQNVNQITDENGDAEDWIELYNIGAQPLNLLGYRLSDNPAQPGMWTFPAIILPAQGLLLVFASGKNRLPPTAHWETAVNENTLWKYLLPNAQPDPAWTTTGFAPIGWDSGFAGIGYGDGDDSTVVAPGTISVLMRATFTVTDTSKIGAALLHIDYDDGFVAYLNGVEIARSGLNGAPPAWDELAIEHEAVMYAGQNPEPFPVDDNLLRQALVPGLNVLSIEVHNSTPGSSDLSVRPFLHFEMRDAGVQFGPNPAWFTLGAIGPFTLHTNFKIKSTGEPILLYDPTGIRIDSLFVNAQEPDYSVGRVTDGAPGIVFFTDASPESTNNGQPSFNSFAAAPTVLVPAGHYAPGLSVAAQSSGPTVLRYTLDGQMPHAFSALYMGPLTFDSTTVLRIRAFSLLPGVMPSETVTRTYLISESFTVPIVSITLENDDFYGPEGIYDNWQYDWERPCHIEYFDTAGTARFFTRSGIRIDGGAGGSRSQPQRSFRLEPDHGVYGEGDVDYPLIPGRPDREDYEAFYLRNGSNMWMGMTYKDALLLRASQNMKVQYSEYRPVVVYINGEYWGVYELREKLDENTYDVVYGADPDSIDILAVSYWYGLVLRAVKGSVDGFLQFHDQTMQATPTDSSFYDQVDQQLDVKAFADYIIAETWAANVDWPYNNIRLWRSSGLDNRWRFSTIDLELGMGWGGWTDYATEMMSFLQNYDPGNLFARLYQALIQNERFRHYFLNRYADMMNTEYQPARLTALADALYDEFAPELPRNFDRWNGFVGYGSLADYQNTVEQATLVTLDHMLQRNNFVRQHIQNHFVLNGQVNITLDVQPPGAGVVQINTIQPGPLPWQGIYFDGVPVTVTAIPNPGFAFSHWDSSQFINNLTLASFVENIDTAAIFVAHFDSVTGPQIIISEINYHPDPTRDDGEWVEFFNYGQTPLNLTGWYFTDANPGQQFFFPSGTSLAAGTRLVVVRDPAKFTAQHPGVPFLGAFNFGLSNDGDALRLIAPPGVLYRNLTYTDSFPWPKGADGGGRTLELLSVNGGQGLAANWFDGCIGGSPGAAYTPCDDPILFSEINYNSDAAFDTDDWVELHNTSNTTIDLSGWRFSDDNDFNVFTLPAGSLLAPDSHLVLYQTTTKFQLLHPTVTQAKGPFNFNLSGSGERIRLFDATGRLQFSVNYRDTLPWPEGADGNGFTLELLDELGRMNDGNNWFDGCPGGSPGQAFFTPCQDTTTGLFSLPEGALLSVFPNPTGRFAELLVDWPAPNTFSTELYDATGRLLETQGPLSAGPGLNRYPLDFSGLAPGVYAIKVRSAEGHTQTLRIVVGP